MFGYLYKILRAACARFPRAVRPAACRTHRLLCVPRGDDEPSGWWNTPPTDRIVTTAERPCSARGGQHSRLCPGVRAAARTGLRMRNSRAPSRQRRSTSQDHPPISAASVGAGPMRISGSRPRRRICSTSRIPARASGEHFVPRRSPPVRECLTRHPPGLVCVRKMKAGSASSHQWPSAGCAQDGEDRSGTWE